MTERPLTPKMDAVLRVLKRTRTAMTPNEIGYIMQRMDDPRVHPASGHGGQRHGGTMGPGSMISPVITALHRRGLIDWTQRPDGLTGIAYVITPAGVRALE